MSVEAAQALRAAAKTIAHIEEACTVGHTCHKADIIMLNVLADEEEHS